MYWWLWVGWAYIYALCKGSYKWPFRFFYSNSRQQSGHGDLLNGQRYKYIIYMNKYLDMPSCLKDKREEEKIYIYVYMYITYMYKINITYMYKIYITYMNITLIFSHIWFNKEREELNILYICINYIYIYIDVCIYILYMYIYICIYIYLYIYIHTHL